MRFIETGLSGAWLIEPDFLSDERGFFARSYCQKEFAAHGLNVNPVQCNISYNKARGTLRGMHFQKAPYAEAKLVRCTQGALYDVIIDLRHDSQTFTKWFGVELTAANRKALYIPEGFAHGFQTLVDDTEVFYQMFNFFSADSSGGVRWDDPAFKIKWPLGKPTMSEKDRAYSDFNGPDFDGFVL